MSLFQIPDTQKLPDYSEHILGRVRVLLKIIGSGRVSGTRLTLVPGTETPKIQAFMIWTF